MNEEDETFKNMMELFEKMFGQKPQVKTNIDDIPFHKGVCNCCLRKTEGQFLYYQYSGNGIPTQLFICRPCRISCPPEHPYCTLKECSLSTTYSKYVTNESQKSPYR